MADRLRALLISPEEAARRDALPSAVAARARARFVDKLEFSSDDWRECSEKEQAAREIRDRTIVSAAKAGMGVRDIARTVDLSPALISRIVKAAS